MRRELIIRTGTAFVAIAAALMALGSHAAAIAADPGARATRVEFYTPKLPGGAPRDGSCWTESIAAPRPGAWRCMIGNAIYDPCFEAPPARGELVCGANPATGQSGFALKLTKPLPEITPRASAIPAPWMILLEDGSVCERFTGTMPMAGGDAARWYCYDPSAPVSSSARNRGVVTKISQGRVWTVDRYAQSQEGPPGERGSMRVRAQRVRVARVWE